MADYIKIPADFFESDPVKLIEKMPNANSLISLYIKLLCAAYKRGRKGKFFIGEIELTDTMLESVFSCVGIGEKLAVLEGLGLAKRQAQRIYVFKFWQDKHDRNSTQYKEWRTAVFKRDGFRCITCGTTEKLQAHHIEYWRNNKKMRYDPANGVTLCRDCHLKAHGGRWRDSGN